MGTLTVKENLMFSASLRLPSGISKREKRKKVEETLVELGLTACADTKVSHYSIESCLTKLNKYHGLTHVRHEAEQKCDEARIVKLFKASSGFVLFASEELLYFPDWE